MMDTIEKIDSINYHVTFSIIAYGLLKLKSEIVVKVAEYINIGNN